VALIYGPKRLILVNVQLHYILCCNVLLLWSLTHIIARAWDSGPLWIVTLVGTMLSVQLQQINRSQY